jgi:hypothetical protein
MIVKSGAESPHRFQTMQISPATFSDASLGQMIADLCAQHVNLTGTRKERNASYLKELCAEVVRRGACLTLT